MYQIARKEPIPGGVLVGEEVTEFLDAEPVCELDCGLDCELVLIEVAEDEVDLVEVVVAKCSDLRLNAASSEVSLYGLLTELAIHQLNKVDPTHRSYCPLQHQAKGDQVSSASTPPIKVLNNLLSGPPPVAEQ